MREGEERKKGRSEKSEEARKGPRKTKDFIENPPLPFHPISSFPFTPLLRPFPKFSFSFHFISFLFLSTYTHTHSSIHPSLSPSLSPQRLYLLQKKKRIPPMQAGKQASKRVPTNSPRQSSKLNLKAAETKTKKVNECKSLAKKLNILPTGSGDLDGWKNVGASRDLG